MKTFWYFIVYKCDLVELCKIHLPLENEFILDRANNFSCNKPTSVKQSDFELFRVLFSYFSFKLRMEIWKVSIRKQSDQRAENSRRTPMTLQHSGKTFQFICESSKTDMGTSYNNISDSFTQINTHRRMDTHDDYKVLISNQIGFCSCIKEIKKQDRSLKISACYLLFYVFFVCLLILFFINQSIGFLSDLSFYGPTCICLIHRRIYLYSKCSSSALVVVLMQICIMCSSC